MKSQKPLSYGGTATDSKCGSQAITPAQSTLAIVCHVVGAYSHYISSGAYPIPDIDAINIVIGFAFIMVGFVMMTRWK